MANICLAPYLLTAWKRAAWTFYKIFLIFFVQLKKKVIEEKSSG